MAINDFSANEKVVPQSIESKKELAIINMLEQAYKHDDAMVELVLCDICFMVILEFTSFYFYASCHAH